MKKILISVLSLLLVVTIPIGSIAQTKSVELTDTQIKECKNEFEMELEKFRELNDEKFKENFKEKFKEMNRRSNSPGEIVLFSTDPGVDPIYPNKSKTFYTMDLSYYNAKDNNKGSANARAYVSDPQINIYSIAGGHYLNSYGMAEGRLGKEFYYAGDSKESMVVTFKGSYDWTIANALVAAEGNSDINITLVVEDLDNGVTTEKSLVSESYCKSTGTWNGKYNFDKKSLEVTARPGHTYAAYIQAEVVSDCIGMGSTSVSAHKRYGSHYIKLDNIKISW